MYFRNGIMRCAFLLAAGMLMALCLAGCGSAGGTYSPTIAGSQKTTPTPSFSVAISPPSVTVGQGASATYTVTITSINGFSAEVTPAVSGLPAGAVGQFDSNSVVPTAEGTTTTLTVNTSASGDTVTPKGTSTITVTASSGGVSKRTTAKLIVQTAPSFTVSVSPPSITVAQGVSATYTVTFTAINGFTGSVTPAISGLPAGAAGQFGNNAITPTAAGATTSLTVSTTAPGDGATPVGTTTITVNGTSGSETQSSTSQLTVQAPGSLLGTIQ